MTPSGSKAFGALKVTSPVSGSRVDSIGPITGARSRTNSLVARCRPEANSSATGPPGTAAASQIEVELGGPSASDGTRSVAAGRKPDPAAAKSHLWRAGPAS
jgi:hypothetical protein